MRLVCDTNIIVSGLLWGGLPCRLLERIEAGVDTLFVSREMLEELRSVLLRPKLGKILEREGLQWADVVRWVVANSTLIVPRPLPVSVVKADPSDDKFLACAKAASVDAVVTGDLHLLALGSWEGIRILTAAAFFKQPGSLPH